MSFLINKSIYQIYIWLGILSAAVTVARNKFTNDLSHDVNMETRKSLTPSESPFPFA